jgi:ParB family transcriptional regulator, chromosome partitioning protein
MISTVPLDRLYLSELNVRKTDTDLDIEELADDIATKGLLQNLVVVPDPARHGFFGVVAGGRRLRALQLLAERGTIGEQHGIPVSREKPEDGREVSLSENLHRVAMNPADEFRAYADIIADYEGHGEADPAARIARCARHFGVTERHVLERLRLADLAPEIFEALRAGRISLEAAKAYAAYPDQALQMKVFAGQEAQGAHRVAAIRAELAGKVYRRGDRQVRYVGLDAYRAAGGRLELELFMGSEDEEVLLDTELLDRLCQEKAEPEAQALAKADGWLDGALAPWPHAHAWPKTPKGFTAGYTASAFRTAAARAKAILVFRIKEDGSGLEATPMVFRRVAEPVPARIAETAAAPATFGHAARPPAGETEVERIARIRRDRIHARAAQLALPSLKGTPLESIAFWPGPDMRSLPPIGEDETGDVVVALLVRIPRAEVERRMVDAEREEDGLPPVRHLDADDDDAAWSRALERSRADAPAHELEDLPA